MTKTILDSDTMKLAVDDNDIVWYLNGEGMPHSSELSVREFLKSDLLHSTQQFRVVGSASNAELLRQLYERRLSGELDSLQVCSPTCCETAEDRSDPEFVLFKMRNYRLAASLGGWHEFGKKDIPSYTLAAYFKQNNTVNNYTRQTLYSHPVWPMLSFVDNLNEDATSQLLALIIDPRWFIDSNDSDNMARLEQFLGIVPRNFVKTAENTDECKVSRCKLVLDCWKTSQPTIVPTTPRNFLWRVWGDKGGSIRGDHAASRLFVSFLRLTWTKAMCLTAQASRLFVPKYFFAKKDECEAFIEHEQNFKPQT